MTDKSLKVDYHHHLLEGEAYQIGFQQGKMVDSIPGLRNYFIEQAEKMRIDQVSRSIALIEAYAPSLLDELQGVADAFGVSREALVFFGQSYLPKGNCSEFLAPGEGKFFHVSNYEFDPNMDDLRLVTTAVKGKYRHIGFSVILLGRYDGINEHGLSISMTASGIPVGQLQGMTKPSNEGLQFWILVRLVLENCKTVEEALKLMETFPICTNTNFLCADVSGAAVIFEARGKTYAYRRANVFSGERLLATNHYNLPSMKPTQPSAMQNSFVRYRKIEEFLSNHQTVDVEKIQQFLAKKYPEGTNCHYYEEYFGTLRTMIFDPLERSVAVCFGAPDVNPWVKFDVFGGVQKEVYPAVFPLEKASPDFWQQEPNY